MSCFVMKPQSIANLAVYIADILNRMDFTTFPGNGLYQFADCTFPDDNNFFDEEKIYRKMYRMNVEAYLERYPTVTDFDFDFVPDFRPDRASLPPRNWIVRDEGNHRKIVY